ncbi:MAG: hypothetical protein MUF75_01140 [Bacteroidia bacterium]|nr:hypothetical protein [Bacteroidia bacterium]
MRRMNVFGFYRIVFGLLLLAIMPAYAQTYYEKGYLVNDKGDTIRGEVKLNQKKEFEVYTKVTFRDEKGIQKNYKIEKVKAYGYKDRQFLKMDYGSEEYFYEVLAVGAISYYKIIFEALYAKTVELETEYFIQKAGSKKVVPMKSSKFKKTMLDWMEDHSEFITAYEEPEPKKFDEAKAIEIINQYNAWKANQN